MFIEKDIILERKEPRPATVEHAEWQAKMNEVSNLAEIIIGKQRHGPIGKCNAWSLRQCLLNLKILKTPKFSYKRVRCLPNYIKI